MTTDAFSKVVDRIQKLRRLAESSNVNEAAAAAGEAQRLMTEHRIAEAQLAADNNAEDEIVTEVDVLAATGMKTPQSWLVRLAMGVCDANGCRIIIRSSRKGGPAGKIRMFGRQSDLDAATYLFHAMTNEINRLADAWVKENPGQGRGATISFKLGAAVEIATRIKAAKEEVTKTLKAAADLGGSGAGSALLVINRAEVAVGAAIKKVIGNSKATWGGSGPSSGDAYYAGKAAGAGVTLGSRGHLGAAAKQIGSK